MMGMDWNKTLVVSNFIHPYYKNVAFLRELYGFPHMRFYGDEKWPTPAEVIPFNQSEGKADRMKPLGGGYFAYRSMMHAVKANPDFAGYLFVMDDVLISRARLQRLDPESIYGSVNPWSSCDLGAPSREALDDWAWSQDCGIAAARAAHPHFSEEQLSRLAAMTGSRSVFWGGQNDVFYLPKKHADAFLEIFELMSLHRVFTEIAISSGLAMIAGPYREISVHYAKRGRKTWATALLDPRCRGTHPVKFSGSRQRAFARSLKMFGLV